MIIEILLMCITSIVIAYIFRPVRPVSSATPPSPHRMPDDYYHQEMPDQSPMTNNPEPYLYEDDGSEPYNLSDSEEVEIENYYDGLGSDYLREINEEFDERIKQIEAELEYEKREKEKVESAKEAILSPEDAELLQKKIISKAKEEFAE